MKAVLCTAHAPEKKISHTHTLSKKQAAILVSVLVIVAGVGVYLVYEATRTEFRFEEWNPEPNRRILMYIRDLTDANLTISFENDTLLMCRVDVELYDAQSGSVVLVREVGNQVNLEATGRQRRVDVVLGTAAKYDLYIQRGQNLNTTVRFGNGAVLNKTRFEAYQTGILRIAVDEHDGFGAYDNLVANIGHPYGISGSLLLLLDIDLPEGYDGRLFTNGAPISFIERVGWGFLRDGEYGTPGDWEEPIVWVDSVCDAIIARLID